MKSKSWILLLAAAAAIGILSVALVLHRRPPGEPARAGRHRVLDVHSYSQRPIGRPMEEAPWVADLLVVDLDGDGLKDILVADCRRNRVCWIRQVRLGVFEEQDIGQPIAAPAHLEVADMRGTGHLDVLVASMGVIPPSNDKVGSVVILENDGTNHFTNHVIIKDVARVSYVTAAKLTQSGRLDLVVGQFGYLQGEVQWLENMGGGQFRSHPLLDLPGTVHAPVADLRGDGKPEIVALVTHNTEEVHVLWGDGRGRFRDQVAYGSSNMDYGMSGLCIADLNQDGRPDLVFTNGDGFDYATPGARPWHGVQWLENKGDGSFAFHRMGDFPGAYSPCVADLTGSGLPDVVACCGFNDWSDPQAVSLMCFQNEGGGRFVPRVLAHTPTHLIVLKAADLFNDGRIELVTGAFMFYPPYNHPSRVTLWELNP